MNSTCYQWCEYVLVCVQHDVPRADAVLADLRVKTIGDLAAWKFAVWAEALVAAAEWEASDFRHK